MDNGAELRQRVDELDEMSLSARREHTGELGDFLSASDSYVQGRAMEILGDLSAAYPDSVVDLLDPISKQLGDETLGKDAARTVKHIAAEHPATVLDRLPLLIAVIDNSPAVTVHVTDSLASLAETAPEMLAKRGVLDRLFGLFDHENTAVRVNVIRTLATIAETEPEALTDGVETLSERLDDRSPAVQQTAAYTLGLLADTSTARVIGTTEELCELCHSQHPAVRSAAMFALSSMTTAVQTVGEEDVDAVVELLAAEDSDTRHHATVLLAELAVEAPETLEPHIPTVTGAVSDDNPQVRRNLERTLKALTETYPDAVDTARVSNIRQ